MRSILFLGCSAENRYSSLGPRILSRCCWRIFVKIWFRDFVWSHLLIGWFLCDFPPWRHICDKVLNFSFVLQVAGASTKIIFQRLDLTIGATRSCKHLANDIIWLISLHTLEFKNSTSLRRHRLHYSLSKFWKLWSEPFGLLTFTWTWWSILNLGRTLWGWAMIIIHFKNLKSLLIIWNSQKTVARNMNNK